jgi:hypothetical protein
MFECRSQEVEVILYIFKYIQKFKFKMWRDSDTYQSQIAENTLEYDKVEFYGVCL